METILIALFALAASVWVGGYVALVVVTLTARDTLEQEARVDFFRILGRRYLLVGGPALVLVLGSGTYLLRDHERDAIFLGTALVAGALVLLLAIAVSQARRMTRLRARAVENPNDEGLVMEIARGGRTAALLRAALGGLTLILVVLGAFLVS